MPNMDHISVEASEAADLIIQNDEVIQQTHRLLSKFHSYMYLKVKMTRVVHGKLLNKLLHNLPVVFAPFKSWHQTIECSSCPTTFNTPT